MQDAGRVRALKTAQDVDSTLSTSREFSLSLDPTSRVWFGNISANHGPILPRSPRIVQGTPDGLLHGHGIFPRISLVTELINVPTPVHSPCLLPLINRAKESLVEASSEKLPRISPRNVESLCFREPDNRLSDLRASFPLSSSLFSPPRPSPRFLAPDPSSPLESVDTPGREEKPRPRDSWLRRPGLER